MLSYFRHRYDPSDEDMQRMLPNYVPWNRDQWKNYYETSETDFDNHVRFTLQKLRRVTTSYGLTNTQQQQLQELMMMGTWDDYCRILEPRQMAYVGC